MMALARRAISVWLMVDGVMTGWWFSQLADSLGGRDLLSVVTLIVRLLAGALSVTAGWLISQRRPAGPPLGIAALLSIGAIGLFGTWTGALPSNLAPSLRWQAAWFQAAMAGLAALFLRRESRDNSPHGSTGA